MRLGRGRMHFKLPYSAEPPPCPAFRPWPGARACKRSSPLARELRSLRGPCNSYLERSSAISCKVSRLSLCPSLVPLAFGAERRDPNLLPAWELADSPLGTQ